MRQRRILLQAWRSEQGSQGLEAAGAALAAALIVLALLAGARGALGPSVEQAFRCAAAALTGGGGGCGGGGAAADTTGTPAPQQGGAQGNGGSGILDKLQFGLDLVGLVPVFGEVADGLNGAISLARGDTTGALLSFGAMVPLAGWAATGGKLVRNGLRYGDEAAGLTQALTRCMTHAPPGIGKGPGLAKPLQASCVLSAGKNFKDHFIRHKGLLEDLLDKKYPKWKDGNGAEFLQDLGKLVDDGRLALEPKLYTINKGSAPMMVYRGEGLTLITKQDGEFVTLLRSGEGRDLGLMEYVPPGP